ncbi:membrane primary amine oxidase-like [Mya arenaria]|nr:membrane primary amine oxidase-like [Mya arenaria]
MYGLDESGQKKGLRTRDVCCFLFAGVLIFAGGVVGGIFIGIYAYHGGPSGDDVTVECVMGKDGGTARTTQQTTTLPVHTTSDQSADCEVCPRRNPFIPQTEQEVFAPLSSTEMKTVRDFLISKGIVTDVIGGNVTFTSNYITGIDIHAPPKKDVLEYKDRNGRFPGRHAKAVVVRGGASPPDVMEFIVGPLNGATRMELTELSSAGENAFTARAINFWEIAKMEEVLKPIQQVLEPLVKESFDGADFNGGELFWWPYNGPPGLNHDVRVINLNALFNPAYVSGDYHLLDMLPLSLDINTTSQTPSEWTIYNIHYLNQGPYSTAQELLDDYNAGTIRKVKLPAGYRDTLVQRFTVGRDTSRPLRVHADMPPPRTYEPKGPRYTIKGHRINWMGWEFDITTRMMRGPALFDVRFQNNKIAYEISLNDIVLQYGSDSFERSNTFYTDATYGIGYYTGTIKGVDCPEHGTLLETSFYDYYSGEAVTSRSICVFESDGEGPAWRHKSNSYQGGLRDSFLVVRIPGTIVNYDYITEFHFKLNGQLQTKLVATGHIQTAFWDAENPNHGNKNTDDSPEARDPFGFRVSDFAQGLIHNHLFGFKVDMDVVDANNSFEVIHLKSGDVVDAFKKMNPTVSKKPDYFRYNVTQYVEYETVQTESGYKANPLEPKYWTIVNENYRNHWGAKRGYLISPMATSTQTQVDSHPTLGAVSFTKYNCAVSKRKESEQFLDSLFDGFRLDSPRGDFSRILDGENIVNEDLVAWVTVGFVHIPSSEDVPMTVAVETGFTLKPYNFFDRTEIFDVPQTYTGEYGLDESPPDFRKCRETD